MTQFNFPSQNKYTLKPVFFVIIGENDGEGIYDIFPTRDYMESRTTTFYGSTQKLYKNTMNKHSLKLDIMLKVISMEDKIKVKIIIGNSKKTRILING